MKTEQGTLDRINEVIVDEKGQKVSMDSMFTDADLDSLGTLITLITLASEFDIFDPNDMESDISNIDFTTFTIKDLVTKCISPTIDTSTAPKTEVTT